MKPPALVSFFARSLGAAALCQLAASAALAQGAEASASSSLADAPSPYYIGVNQALTHDSNVFRVPFGPSDNYSSSTLLGGFDQALGRQRLFGTASVSLNRYQDQTQLNNTSYSLASGFQWATVQKLSGDVTATLNRSLAAPIASAGTTPEVTRYTATSKGIAGSARWGGDGAISLLTRLGYSSQENSGGTYISTSNNEFASFGAYYRPGPTLQLGVALRVDRTRAPYAFLLNDGSYQGNDVRGRNLDFLIDYNNGSSLSGGARVSYTRQTNSNFDNSDFSGLTGSLNVAYRATGKIGLNFYAARDAGYNANNSVYAPQTLPTSPTSPAPTTPNTTGSTTTLYENNQVTNSVGLGATYAATAKIGVSANARYSRARLIASSGAADGTGAANVIDTSRGVSLGANYAFSRALSFACSAARERREVDGPVSYGYTDNLFSCSGQFLWR